MLTQTPAPPLPPPRAPLDPSSIIPVENLHQYNPNEVLVVTTGSQAEPRAQLSLASRRASNSLKILPSDLVLYSAKVGLVVCMRLGAVWVLKSALLQGSEARAPRESKDSPASPPQRCRWWKEG